MVEELPSLMTVQDSYTDPHSLLVSINRVDVMLSNEYYTGQHSQNPAKRDTPQ